MTISAGRLQLTLGRHHGVHYYWRQMVQRDPVRPVMLLAVLIALCCSSCHGGKRFYPVRGKLFVDGKPAAGVTVVLHSLDDTDPEPVQPSAVVEKDGSFVLKSFVVKERVVKDGAPPGKYRVTCAWYPEDRQKYLGMEKLPDKLGGKYADWKTSQLLAEVAEGPTELPVFMLETKK